MPSKGRHLLRAAVMCAAIATAEPLFAADAGSQTVTELTVEQAAALAGLHGDVELSHLRTLSPEVADLLSRCGGVILLNGLTTLSPETAASLSQQDAFIELNGLAELPLDTALALITPDSPRALSLRGLQGINDETAELMGAHRGHLRLAEGLAQPARGRLADLGVDTIQIPGRSGVWLPASTTQQERKIAAIGVRIAGGVTTHGFAINCNPDLSWFDRIIPCGIADAGVTSLTRELNRNVTIDELLPFIEKRLTEFLPRVMKGA